MWRRRHKEDDEVPARDRFFELTSFALIAEYNAVREANLSRDSLLSTAAHKCCPSLQPHSRLETARKLGQDLRIAVLSAFANFMVVIFSATIAGLPIIISEKVYILLPLISLLLCALVLTFRRQRWLLNELSNYEGDVLRPRLQAFFKDANHSRPLPDYATGLWQWTLYQRQQEGQGPISVRVGRRLLHEGVWSLSVLASVGYLLLFFYYRGVAGLSLPELVLVLLAALYWVMVLVMYVRSTLAGIRSLMSR